MKVDVDCKERVKIILSFLLQSYKVVMGSMLLLFVPQTCEDGICSVTDNLRNTGNVNRAGLVLNFISVAFFALTYGAELRRENWCVHNFDINHDVGDNNLAIILKDKPVLLAELHSHNKRYYYITVVTFFVYFLNFIVSNIVLFQDESFMSIGLAPYLSYIILVLMKLYNCYSISLNSMKGDKAMSAYMTEFTSFNVIDADRLDEIKNEVESGSNNVESGSNNVDVESKTTFEPQPIPTNLVLP